MLIFNRKLNIALSAALYLFFSDDIRSFKTGKKSFSVYCNHDTVIAGNHSVVIYVFAVDRSCEEYFVSLADDRMLYRKIEGYVLVIAVSKHFVKLVECVTGNDEGIVCAAIGKRAYFTFNIAL